MKISVITRSISGIFILFMCLGAGPPSGPLGVVIKDPSAPFAASVSSTGALKVYIEGSTTTQPANSGTSGGPVSVSGTVPISIAAMPTTPVTGSVTATQATGSNLHVVVDSAPSTAVTGSVSVTNASIPVTGSFYQATQPISGSVSVGNFPASQAVTGAFYPATQPVSGTFWQTTQPVSLAAMPTTPVTGTFWQSTQPVSLASLPALAAGSNVIGHVIVDTAPTTTVTGTVGVSGTVPVTGTFWQATQPVSGSVAVSNLPVTQPVSIASMPSTPVTGSFYQATQPISGSISVSNFPASQAVTGTFYQATQPVSGTVSISGTVPVSMPTTNPCESPSSTILGVNGSTSGTSAVQIIALSGSTKIYVCAAIVTGVSGTSPTFSLKYGTGTACATGGVTVWGPITTTALSFYALPRDPIVTPAGQELCYVDGGTSPVQNYAITYVQQ